MQGLAKRSGAALGAETAFCMNARSEEAAPQHQTERPKLALGRSPQAGFSAHAKCCGTAFGKEGSKMPFAAISTNDCLWHLWD